MSYCQRWSRRYSYRLPELEWKTSKIEMLRFGMLLLICFGLVVSLVGALIQTCFDLVLLNIFVLCLANDALPFAMTSSSSLTKVCSTPIDSWVGMSWKRSERWSGSLQCFKVDRWSRTPSSIHSNSNSATIASTHSWGAVSLAITPVCHHRTFALRFSRLPWMPYLAQTRRFFYWTWNPGPSTLSRPSGMIDTFRGHFEWCALHWLSYDLINSTLFHSETSLALRIIQPNSSKVSRVINLFQIMFVYSPVTKLPAATLPSSIRDRCVASVPTFEVSSSPFAHIHPVQKQRTRLPVPRKGTCADGHSLSYVLS